MSKYLLFSFLVMPLFLNSLVPIFFFICCLPSFFFHAFFSSSLRVELFLFFFLSLFWGPCVDSCLSSFFLFFAWGTAFFFFVFGVELFSSFSFLFSGGAAFCFWLLFLSFFWGPCVFTLSFHHLSKPFEIDPMFPDRLFDSRGLGS